MAKRTSPEFEKIQAEARRKRKLRSDRRLTIAVPFIAAVLRASPQLLKCHVRAVAVGGGDNIIDDALHLADQLIASAEAFDQKKAR